MFTSNYSLSDSDKREHVKYVDMSGISRFRSRREKTFDAGLVQKKTFSEGRRQKIWFGSPDHFLHL
jgi:hypothetical protein